MEKLSGKVKGTWCFIWVAVTVIALFMACSWWNPSLPTKNYFIINYTPVPKISTTSQRLYPYSLQVGQFDVQRIFTRQNIAYRFSPNQIQYYELEQWAVRPDHMIKDMVFKHLEASTITNHVGIDFFDTKPDFRIEGTVEALEKLDAGDLFFAHLAMTFKMLRLEDGEQVWNYSFDQRRQVYSKKMVLTVRGLSYILQSEMDVVIGQLDSLFLSLETGTPWITEGERVTEKPASADSTDTGIDESAFEIIPEKKK